MSLQTSGPSALERLADAVRGQRRDRVPVFCNLLDQGARELGVSLPDYYADGELVAEAQIRMRQRYGHDNVWSLFFVGREAAFAGCREFIFADDGPPNVADFVIKDPADIERMEVPDDLLGHPDFAETEKCMRILRREVGGRYPICAYITSAMTLPAMLMGMEAWMGLLLKGPAPLCEMLLEKCSALCRAHLRAYRALGADVLLYTNAFVSADFLPMRLVTQRAIPWMKRDLQEGLDGVVVYAASARLARSIPDLLEVLPIQAFYPSPLDDIGACQAAARGRALVAGTINDIALVDWTPDEVREHVRRIMEVGKRQPQFMFGTIVMPLSIPEANIRAMVDAALEFGAWGGAM